MHLDEFDAARTQCEYAISLDPKSPVSHNLMGQSLATLGNIALALMSGINDNVLISRMAAPYHPAASSECNVPIITISVDESIIVNASSNPNGRALRIRPVHF